MRRIYLDAGRSDEYYLDLGAQAFAAELDKLDVPYTLELFDGTHARLTYRYPGRDPRAGQGVSGVSPSRAHASTAGHGPNPGVRVDVAGAGQDVAGAVERDRALRAVRVVVRAHQPRVLHRHRGRWEERHQLLRRARRRRRRDQQHARGGLAAAGHVMHPQQARERVAEHDRRLRDRVQLARERVEPRAQPREVGIGQVRVVDLRVAGPQPTREPGLPVAGAGALIAVEDQVGGAPHAGRYRTRTWSTHWTSARSAAR